MSFQALVSDFKAPNNVSFKDGFPRRSANFQPSVWGDYFLSNHSNTDLEEDDMVRKQLEELKEVRSMLVAAEKSSEKLSLIDLIQRLGLSYYFEGEINDILQHIQNPYDIDDDEDLYIMALRFRLLRQQGHFVSCDIFNKFTNERGEFKNSIVKDEAGLLSLYEASHLRMNGENILDDALAFTTTHLQAMAMDSSSNFSNKAEYALKWPIYKSFPRLAAKHYISLYEKDPFNNNVLLTFAKLDYNILQKLYQKELREVSRWWKDVKLMEQLSFARDRVVECYVWALTVYYEPKYSRARILLAKIITFISVLDDMYDVYATWDELELFTHAIERWDINDIEILPNYMKVVYQTIFEVYGEVEQDVCKEENNIAFTLDYAKEMMKGLCKVFFMEATWFHKGYVPTIEEYMKVALVSSSYYVFTSTILLGMGVASKEVIQWAKNDPVLLKATGVIGRIMNDITSHKFEQERGHVSSAVECYMNQYGVSEEDALVELDKQVVKAWKDVTEDYIKSTKIPNVILMRVLNISRASYLFYREEDGYTIVDGATKNFITSLVLESVPI